MLRRVPKITDVSRFNLLIFHSILLGFLPQDANNIVKYPLKSPHWLRVLRQQDMGFLYWIIIGLMLEARLIEAFPHHLSLLLINSYAFIIVIFIRDPAFSINDFLVNVLLILKLREFTIIK